MYAKMPKHCIDPPTPMVFDRSEAMTARTGPRSPDEGVNLISGNSRLEALDQVLAIIMGEARGAAMAVVAEAGLDIYEIATRKVKQAIVGHGAAQKLAVAKMVQRMLNLAELPAPDAADALALALVHARENSRFGLTTPKKI